MIKNVEQKIKQIRELKNYSQSYLANELGVSVRAYSKIESGETQLTIQRLNEISKILDVNPFEILGFDSKQIFNNCRQSGYIGINHITLHEKLFQLYDEKIAGLKSEIESLKAK